MLARRREEFGFATVLFHVSGCAVVEGRLKDTGYVSLARTRGARESTCSVVLSELASTVRQQRRTICVASSRKESSDLKVTWGSIGCALWASTNIVDSVWVRSVDVAR